MAVSQVLFQPNCDIPNQSDNFALDVIEGLSRRQKQLPSKYFYDNTGCVLFQKITALPEYYLTRSETEILEKYCPKILQFAPKGSIDFVEIGAGCGEKTILFLYHAIEQGLTCRYVPLDISSASLLDLTIRVKSRIPQIVLLPRQCDIGSEDEDLWPMDTPHRFVLFLGSSIGNFDTREAERFIAKVAYNLVAGDLFLIGFDLVKSPDLLVPAYADSQGLTAEFNFNLLRRINREIGARFNISAFRHVALYNETQKRMESYLESLHEQVVPISKFSQAVRFKAGERILTEYSCKYTRVDVQNMAQRHGFRIVDDFTDSKGYFLNSLWERL